MRLLWTDTLAALLVEHDRVAPELVEGWLARPKAYRLDDGCDPLELARALLDEFSRRERVREAPSPVRPSRP